MKRTAVTLIGTILLLVLAFGSLSLIPTQPDVAAQSRYWPGRYTLWQGTGITTTMVTQTVNINGPSDVWVYYDTGLGSGTANITLTVKQQWRDNVFKQQTASATISTTQASVGVLTVTLDTGAYLAAPDLVLNLQASANRFTPTVEVVGQ